MTRLLMLALALPLAGQAADPDQGRQIALGVGCTACHEVPGVSASGKSTAPSLAGVGSRLSQDEIFWWIVDASRFNPATPMPAYGRIKGTGGPRLSTTQIEDVAAFLATLKWDANP